MSDIDKYIVANPTPEDLVEINSALTKSEQYVNEIIVCADDIEETNSKIQSLVELANNQKDNKVSIFSGKKTAIESLQALADFQADAIKDLWKYQKLVFEQFSKLSETSNKLLFLGVANAAVTRALIEQLKTKSSKKLSEDARRHLLNVIKDLERQADAQDRINRLREATSSAISNEAQNRRLDIANIQVSIDRVKESTSFLINDETQKRMEAIRGLYDSLNEIKQSYALASSLNQEVKNRITALDNLKARLTELESKLVNYNKSLEESVRYALDSHSAKEELLQNEINRLQSKTNISIWIAIIALLLSILSFCTSSVFLV